MLCILRSTQWNGCSDLHRLELDLAQAPALTRGASRRRWEWVGRNRRHLVKDEGREAVALGDGGAQRIGEPSLLL